MAYGFGIIGCGLIGRFHARAIQDVSGAKLIGCYNRTPQKGAQLAAEFNCTAYSSLDALLANPAIQIVTVATPSGAHQEPAVAAARAKKHVIVEKPLEITLRRCDAIIAACQKHNVQLATIFPSRFHDAAGEIKRAVEENRFGKLTLGNASVKWFRTQQYYDSGAWRGTWELDGGGALMNQAIHSVDLLAWFMGPVAEVRAQTATLAHERIAVEDVCVAALQFANGALGTIEATTAAFPGRLKRIEVSGSAGTAIMEEEDMKAWDFLQPQRRDRTILARMAERQSTGGGASDPAAIGHHGHARQIADFVAALKQGRAPQIDGSEGRRAVEIILAIYKAAESGRPVALPLASDPVLKSRRVQAAEPHA
ncbi:MAG TPA: Gfo/Idh/MocA family oxidoreductase [Pirellulales bacterium]|jgi:predicted dehydrogenase|nr:Gfo/Idh/MocA family oxidoreductase [Pirellulales bacterium]